MKKIRYKYVYAEVNHGTEENPDIEQAYVIKNIPYTEANEEIAKAEAHNGEYTIEDDGIAAEEQPTHEQRIAELEAAFEMILSGVTE